MSEVIYPASTEKVSVWSKSSKIMSPKGKESMILWQMVVSQYLFNLVWINDLISIGFGSKSLNVEVSQMVNIKNSFITHFLCLSNSWSLCFLMWKNLFIFSSEFHLFKAKFSRIPHSAVFAYLERERGKYKKVFKVKKKLLGKIFFQDSYHRT